MNTRKNKPCLLCKTEDNNKFRNYNIDGKTYRRSYCIECTKLWCNNKNKEERKKRVFNKIEDLTYEIDEIIYVEQWKDIYGYEGLYKVSDLGRIKSIIRDELILKPFTDHKGYLRLKLFKNKSLKDYSIHRLVGIHFLANPLNLPEVNHKWGIKMDNRASELEWNTSKDNCDHKYKVLGYRNPKGENCKRSIPIWVQVLDNKELIIGVKTAANKIGCSERTIHDILKGKRESYENYRFKYASPEDVINYKKVA